MKALAAAAILAVIGIMILSDTVNAQNWRIEPGVSVGDINAETAESDLVRLYGEANVAQQKVDLGEGLTDIGTVIFPSDPSRRADILWQDETRRFPDSVSITGGNSRWTLPKKVTLGISLKELESLNARAFTLYGFGWDYGGTVASWQGGALADAFGGDEHVLLRLDADTSGLEEEDLHSVLGDVEYASDSPVMQQLNPVLREIIVMFPERAD